MKVVNLLFAVIFLFFAFLQINDPDPFLWILIYGAMAVVCIMAAFSYYSRPFLLALLGAYLFYSLFFIDGLTQWWAQDDRTVLFDDVAKMEHLYIEESREFLGLLICIIVLSIHLLLAKRVKAVG